MMIAFLNRWKFSCYFIATTVAAEIILIIRSIGS
jgi:hypothetical protein